MKTGVKFLETSGTLAALKYTGVLEIAETYLVFTSDFSGQSPCKLSQNSLRAISGTDTVLQLIFANPEAKCVLELPSPEIKTTFHKALEVLLSVQEEIPDADTRKCPICAEKIKQEAIKCRFCGEFLQRKTPLPSEEANNSSQWYIQDGSKRVGPLTKNEVDALFRQNAIDTETLVWKRGQSDWLPLRLIPELSNLADVPPPLTGNSISNLWLWWIAFAPIYGGVLIRVITGFIKCDIAGEIARNFQQAIPNSFASVYSEMVSQSGGRFTSELKYAAAILPDETFAEVLEKCGRYLSDGVQTEILMLSWLPWIIFLSINGVLCLLDSWTLKQSGWTEKRVSAGWCLLMVPVYIGLRAKVTKSGWGCFVLWFVSFLIFCLMKVDDFNAVFGVDTILRALL